VRLRQLGMDNWKACVVIRAAPGQERFVAPVSYYLCMCHYERIWHPLAIHCGRTSSAT
jgi:hypothetical protein